MLTIRPIHSSDAMSYLAFRQQLATETDFMYLTEQEIETSDKNIENIKSQITHATNIDNELFLVLIDQSKDIVGFIRVHGSPLKAIWGNGYVIMGILQKHTGQGYGKKLIEEMIGWAKKTGLYRLELTTMLHNKAAKALYEKMGFEVEGIKRKLAYINGHYIDEYMMSLLL